MRGLCTYWHPKSNARCQAEAEVAVVAPDGDVVPGSRECRKHADAVVAEYQAKLDPGWHTVPLDEYGRPILPA